jgi:agmatine deiminase
MIANAEDIEEARKRCGPSVEVIELEIDDSWLRDTGPTFLVDGRGGLGGVDWPFNNWGEISPEYERDRLLAQRLLERTGAQRFEAPFILEGGAVHTDGRGTLLTTENVVLNPNRNPGLTKAEAEEVFRAFLGVERVVWLEHALDVDSTDGHVDNLACFVRPGVVLALTEPDSSDSHHAPLRENLRRLERARDTSGKPFEIIEIRQPGWREWRDQRVCASYVNFYIANGGVVVPVFDDPQDAPALESISHAFPDREVVAVPALDIVKGEGCIHCITQQQPLP